MDFLAGWGLDWLWPFLLGYPQNKIAVIDQVSIAHVVEHSCLSSVRHPAMCTVWPTATPLHARMFVSHHRRDQTLLMLCFMLLDYCLSSSCCWCYCQQTWAYALPMALPMHSGVHNTCPCVWRCDFLFDTVTNGATECRSHRAWSKAMQALCCSFLGMLHFNAQGQSEESTTA